MEEKEILSGIVDVLTDKPYIMRVLVNWTPKRPLLDRLLFKKPKFSKVGGIQEFAITPCKVGTMYRIAGRAATLPDTLLQGAELVQTVMPLIPEHLPTMVYVIAAAIQNDHREPEKDLLKFIERNFNAQQVAEAVFASLDGLSLQDFLNTIVSVKGAGIVLKPKTSPLDGME